MTSRSKLTDREFNQALSDAKKAEQMFDNTFK